MIAVFGITKIQPINFTNALIAELRNLDQHVSCAFYVKLSKVPNTKIVMFFSLADFRNEAAKLQKRSIAIVFDSAERFFEMENITILNPTKAPLIGSIKKIIDVLNNTKQIATIYKKHDFITPIIDEKKSVGLLHSYNTLLYKVTKKEFREPLREAILLYMGCEIDKAQLDVRVARILPVRGQTRENGQALVDLMKGEEADRLRTALALTTGGAEVELVSENHKVSAYDLRYLMASIAKLKKAQSDGKGSKP